MRRSLNCNIELNEKSDGTGELTFTRQTGSAYSGSRDRTTVQLDQNGTKAISGHFTMLGVRPAG